MLNYLHCVVYDSGSGVKLSLGKTRVKKQQVEMMIGQNIITRTYHNMLPCTVFLCTLFSCKTHGKF